MKRMLVLALTISMGHTSVAWAGESLLSSAQRIARDAVSRETAATREAVSSPRARVVAPAPKAAAQDQQPLALGSGMRKRTKLLIGLGAAAAFIGTAWAIDHGVEDNTPSSHGLRED